MNPLTRRLHKLEGKRLAPEYSKTIVVSFVDMTHAEASRAWTHLMGDCITRLPTESEDAFIERAKAYYGPGNPIQVIYLDDGYEKH